MNKFSIAIGAIALLGIGFLAGEYVQKPANPLEQLLQVSGAVCTNPVNGTYMIDGTSVIFAGGIAQTGDYTIFGVPENGDLNNDGTSDAAVMLVSTSEGSGIFYYIAAAVINPQTGGYEGTNAILIGDRIAPQTMRIVDGVIEVNYADRKPNEPFTVRPSIGTTDRFKVVNKLLVPVL